MLNKKMKSLLSGYLRNLSNIFFLVMGVAFVLTSLTMITFACLRLGGCLFKECDIVIDLIDFVGFLIISVAIFDVGRYLLEEEVFRERELRSPKEARQSLTKFMVIIVIAMTLEALLNVIRTGTSDVRLLLFPSLLFFVAAALLVGLGLYQRYSVIAEVLVHERGRKELEKKELP